MSSGTPCPMCGRHMNGPECRAPQCGYVEGPGGNGRLTRNTPRRRATDEGSFLSARFPALAPEHLDAAREGIADARAELNAAKERAEIRRKRGAAA